VVTQHVLRAIAVVVIGPPITKRRFSLAELRSIFTKALITALIDCQRRYSSSSRRTLTFSPDAISIGSKYSTVCSNFTRQGPLRGHFARSEQWLWI
jgi:hypothetical protein